MDFSFGKALVTGGAGFIGSHLVDALIAQRCEVTIIDNLSTGHMSNLEHIDIKNSINFCEGDIRDENLLMKAADGCDVIFHQAAVVSVQETIDYPVDSALINEIGTLNVLEAARKNKVRKVVFASSCSVYGDDPQLPKHEDMNTKPSSPYAVQKFAGELYASIYHELHGLDTVCLRYFNVYGPRQDPSSSYSGVISIFMTKAKHKQRPTIYGDGSQYRDFVFVKDVVRCNLVAANAEGIGGKVFNVGTGKFVRIRGVWDMIGQIAKVKIHPEYKPARPGDILESVANIDRAVSELDFASEFSFEKGLEITFQWYMGM